MRYAARAQALAGGCALAADDLALEVLRAAVLRGEFAYVDVRAWFAERLRTLP